MMASVNVGNKRRKQEVFKKGNIIKVSVKNFTTYSYGEFNLSPRLNMIIGPNGTGKSTLVSAICLGLGGKLDIIKRKSLESMIKLGEERSEIFITIMGNDKKPVEIHRSFTKLTTSWKLNGKKASEKEVLEFVSSLNIQLDNLCHFLPQERVAEFAGLSPEKLLLETERTLKSGDLYISHQNLIELEADYDNAKRQLNDLEERYESLKGEKEDLSRDVERLNQYNEKDQELRYHKFLLPYAIFNDGKERKNILKKQRDEAKLSLDQIDSKIEPIHKEKTATQLKLSDLNKKIEDLNMTLEQLRSKYDGNNNTVLNARNTINDLNETLKRTLMSKVSLNKEIDKIKLRIQSLEEEKRTKFGDISVVSAERDELSKARREKRDEIYKIRDRTSDLKDSQVSKTNRQHQLVRSIKQESLKLNSRDKLSLLNPHALGSIAQNNAGLQTVYYLHEEMRKNPEWKTLYNEAPVVTCEVRNPKLAGVLEKVITYNNLVSVTFNSDDSFRKIPRELFNKFNTSYRINEGYAPESMIPSLRLSHYGFDGYLSDGIEGPPEVLKMLNINSKLNQIPFTSKLTNNQLEALLSPDSNGRIPFMRFVVDDQLFSITRSKYGSKQFISSSETVTGAKFFGKGMPKSYENELRNEINNMERDLQNTRRDLAHIDEELKQHSIPLQELEDQLKDIEELLELVTDVLREHKGLTSNLESRRAELKRKETELNTDQTSRITQIKKKILKHNNDLVKHLGKSQEYLNSMNEEQMNLQDLQIEQIQFVNRVEAIDRLLIETEVLRSDLKTAYEEAKRNYQSIKDSDAARQIQEQKSQYAEGEEQALGDLAKQYLQENKLTQTFVRTKINHIEDELRVMAAGTNRNSVERLKRVEQELEQVETMKVGLRNPTAALAKRIEDLRAQWEPELAKLIEGISLSFKKKFVNVASDGEVQLKKMDKFKDWRLEILVKFREESELKILDRQSQSGGERAVSTIFFIMALQGMTQAPLRIVDEINQGMDPSNEKAAHKHLVHTASLSSDSQYFLVTPKLLTGLYYHPSMKIHCIFTGPLIDPFKGRDVDFMDFTNLY